jgi:archaellum component FlaG (FlaF/FlaG flagellin family)
MASSRKAVTLVVALLVAGLMSSFLLPVAIDAMVADESQTITQNTTETVTLSEPDLNATLDSVDDTADTATYTIEAGNSSTTTTVDNGTNTTVTVDGTDVTIATEEVTTSTATTEYTYPTTYGWTNGAGAMWAVIPLMLVLAIFIFFTKVALDTM